MATVPSGVLVPLSDALPEELLPHDFLTLDDGAGGSLLDHVFLLEYGSAQDETGTILSATILVDGEIVFGLPVCPALSLVIGAGSQGYTTVAGRVRLGDDWFVELDQFAIALRVDRSVLRPVDPAIQHAEIALSSTLRLSAAGLQLVDAPALSLTKSYLGDSGIAISAADVKLDLRQDAAIAEVEAAGFGPEFVGLYIGKATIDLPADLAVPVPALAFEHCFIGGNGFTGKVTADWTVGGAPPAGTLFGFGIELHRVALALRESSFVEASIEGLLSKIPYFDQPALVDLSVGAGGKLSVSVAAKQPAPVKTTPAGLVKLRIPNVLELEVASLAFEHDAQGTRLYLSGTITPTLSFGAWPAITLKRLGVDARGHVTVEGGWIDLPTQYAVDFGGFALELSRIGFGAVEGSTTKRWFGLTGGVRFTALLPAGVSVDGLRVVFDTADLQAAPTVSFEGIGLEFGVPDVFRFEGAVAYHEFPGGGTEFRGHASLDLYALDMSVSVQIVIGHNANPAFNYAYLYLDAKLAPSGIPIFNTGLSLYGFAGLYAQNMAPALDPAVPERDRWYRWYLTPAPGVTDQSKWAKSQGDMAVGLGVTVGTADAGFSFSVKALLVVLLPKPVIMLDGKADFLKLPSPQTSGQEGTLHAFAMYDTRSGLIEVAVDATYRVPLLVDVHADARAHFETPNPAAWFFTIGQMEPPEQRAQAHFFDGILDGWFALRVDSVGAQVGAGIELHKHLSAGPASLDVDASAAVGAKLAYAPPQIEVMAALHGSARAGIAGANVGVSVDAIAELAAPKPFVITARFHACAKIIIKTICVDFPFEYRVDGVPDVPAALAAVGAKHPRPLLAAPAPQPAAPAPAPTAWALDVSGAGRMTGVAPDAAVSITFERQVRNVVPNLFVNGDVFEDKWHAVGERTGYRYQHQLVGLRVYDERSGSAADVASATLVDVRGAWQTSGGSGETAGRNTVLQLFATSPFEGASSSITNLPCYDTPITDPCAALPLPATTWVCEDVLVPAREADAWGLKVREVPAPASDGPVGGPSRDVPPPRAGADTTAADATTDRCTPRVHRTMTEILRALLRDARRRVPLLLLMLLLVASLLMLRTGSVLSPALATMVRAVALVGVLIVLVGIVLYLGLAIVAEWTVDQTAHLVCGDGCACRGYRDDPGGRPGDGTDVPGSADPGGSTPPGSGRPGGDGAIPPGDDGMVVVRQCRQVATTGRGTIERAADRAARLKAWIDETTRWSASRQTFRPNRCYRIEIDTKTLLKKHDDDVSARSATSVVRFQTAGPPATASGLEPYVGWTMPAFEPGETGTRRAYRQYDVGVRFAETYVDVLYRADGDDVELRLFDNNGQPLLDVAGNPIVLPNAWTNTPEPVPTREQSVLTAQLQRGECLPEIRLATSPVATLSLGTLALRPQTYHEVHVVRTNDAAHTPLARWSFVTSRFTTFSDMAGTFTPASTIPRVVPGISAAALRSATSFDAAAQALGLLPGAPPEQLLVSPVVAAPGSAATIALLLEAPEPIEWARTSLVLKVGSGAAATTHQGSTLHVVVSGDETRAVVMALDAAGQPVTLAAGPATLQLRFRRYAGSDRPIYAVAGDTADEVVALAFTLGAGGTP